MRTFLVGVGTVICDTSSSMWVVVTFLLETQPSDFLKLLLVSQPPMKKKFKWAPDGVIASVAGQFLLQSMHRIVQLLLPLPVRFLFVVVLATDRLAKARNVARAAPFRAPDGMHVKKARAYTKT